MTQYAHATNCMKHVAEKRGNALVCPSRFIVKGSAAGWAFARGVGDQLPSPSVKSPSTMVLMDFTLLTWVPPEEAGGPAWQGASPNGASANQPAGGTSLDVVACARRHSSRTRWEEHLVPYKYVMRSCSAVSLKEQSGPGHRLGREPHANMLKPLVPCSIAGSCN